MAQHPKSFRLQIRSSQPSPLAVGVVEWAFANGIERPISIEPQAMI